MKNKTIVIIGGTSGIGLAAALAIIREGGKVVCVGRDDGHAVSATASMRNDGVVLTGDAIDPKLAGSAIQRALTQFGSFDGLYHVAGGSGRSHGDGPLHEVSDAGIDYTLQLNLNSVIYSNRAAVQHFVKKGGGVILNLTSVLAEYPSPKFFATHVYAAAKAAITCLTRSAAAYYAPHNIRVNGLAPALVETPMSQRAVNDPAIMQWIKSKQPLDGGRIGSPNDLAAAAVFFLSDESRFVTGQILAVDGGWSVSDPSGGNT